MLGKFSVQNALSNSSWDDMMIVSKRSDRKDALGHAQHKEQKETKDNEN